MAKRKINKNIIGSVEESDDLDGTYTVRVFDRKTNIVYYTATGFKTFEDAYHHGNAQTAIIRREETI